MDKFVIIADVSCDLNKDIRNKYDLEYLPGHITLPTGEDVLSTLDWESITRDSFYSQLKNKKKTFTTSPASIEETKIKFKEFLDKGINVIYIALSHALSGSYNFALQAKKELEKSYPNRKIEVIDSLRYSTSLGLIAIYASLYKKEGHDFDSTVKYINSLKTKVHQMGPMDDLFFLSRKGRITNAKAFFGTLIGIKPLGDFDPEGRTTILTKAKGKDQAINFTIEYIKKTIVDPENQILCISHTDRKENAELILNRIKKEIKVKDIILVECSPSSAINIGPGLAACFFLGNDISKDMEVEKEIMNEVVNA